MTGMGGDHDAIMTPNDAIMTRMTRMTRLQRAETQHLRGFQPYMTAMTSLSGNFLPSIYSSLIFSLTYK